MRAIDSPHNITPVGIIFRKINFLAPKNQKVHFLRHPVYKFEKKIDFGNPDTPLFRYVISNAAFTASVWLMVSLIIDRYCALCRRFENLVVAQKQNDQRIHIILSTLSLVSFLYSVPRYFELNISFNYDHSVYVVTSTNLLSNSTYMIYYRIIGSLIFYSIVPYIIVFIAFVKFSFFLRNFHTTRVSLNVPQSKTAKENESNRLLLALSIRFLLSRFPSTLVDIYEMISGSQEEFLQSTIAMFCVYVSNFLVIFSSASTFFLFFIFSCRFRKFVCGTFTNLFKSDK
jgi:hypothetical protein